MFTKTMSGNIVDEGKWAISFPRNILETKDHVT